MNKNQIIGFTLIGIILIGFVFITKPSEEEIKAQQKYQDSIAIAQQIEQKKTQDSLQNLITKDTTQTQTHSDTINNDSIIQNELTKEFGVFANNATGKEQEITLENDLLKIKFSNKGAQIRSVQLKEYKTYSQQPLILFNGKNNKFNINFSALDKIIQTNKLYFEPNTEKNENTQTIKFKAKIDEQKYIEFLYTLTTNSYIIDFNINFVNLEKIIPINTTFIEIYWEEYLKHLERGEKWEQQNTMLFYKLYDESVKKLKNKKDYNEEIITSKVRWISYKQQFFNSTLIAEKGFNSATISAKTLPEDTTNLFLMTSKISVPFQLTNNTNIKLKYFFGPNKYKILRKIKVENKKMKLENLIPLGGKFLGLINKAIIIPFFNVLGKFMTNYGLIILVMTIIIKLTLMPLTYRSYASSAKMRILKPEIDKATKKIPKDDQMKKQQATMSLYKKAGVNPMGGCLPVLLQFPILVALYRFFPASIELRQKPFLWVKDLSTYDAILTWSADIPIINWIFGNHISLFTLLMAITMIINTMLTNANSAMDSSNPQAKTMKIMMYFMPVMMIVWFNGYSAGLSYYYFLSTLIGIIQILVIRKMINEEKVLAKLKANMKTKKNQKKSKFQQRLEQMQKQQTQYNKNKKLNKK